ncbi:MAG: DUF2325 domain-containing protein [Arcobacter sp.]|uniref:DUF2325 domain-containing protein n=1 Tax=Arcobacter sp. TaxID=1872629 RepID=UPI00258456EE|nr:DUF2325 domain-containing protein [Arcobacter sp.]MDD3007280.1 DUF2325 domain-containing protein [Arcobacter sp.]MDY3204038.1 DUF2325 domain-containing protein [Arcobacter sp.]
MILVIGGDRIESIKEFLNQKTGESSVVHWDGRNVRITDKKIPKDTNHILLITDFLKHNTMYHFKKEAKRKNIPLLCSKRSINFIHQIYEQRDLNEVE